MQTVTASSTTTTIASTTAGVGKAQGNRAVAPSRRLSGSLTLKELGVHPAVARLLSELRGAAWNVSPGDIIHAMKLLARDKTLGWAVEHGEHLVFRHAVSGLSLSMIDHGTGLTEAIDPRPRRRVIFTLQMYVDHLKRLKGLLGSHSGPSFRTKSPSGAASDPRKS